MAIDPEKRNLVRIQTSLIAVLFLEGPSVGIEHRAASGEDQLIHYPVIYSRSYIPLPDLCTLLDDR